MSFVVGLLADHPEHLETVAGWLYHEWGWRNAGSSVAQSLALLRTHVQRNALPLMVVAVDGGTCIGCASIRPTDLSGREDLAPWLASVFVLPHRRRTGVGAAVVRAAEQEARRLGFPMLYLFTPDQQAFYAANGWVEHGGAVHSGQPVTIMSKMVNGSA